MRQVQVQNLRRRFGWLYGLNTICIHRWLVIVLPAKLGVNATTFSDRSNQPQVMLVFVIVRIVVVVRVVEGSHGGRRERCQMSRLSQSPFHVSTG